MEKISYHRFDYAGSYVFINKAFIPAKKSDENTFDEGEVSDEQNDALLYQGFLIPDQI